MSRRVRRAPRGDAGVSLLEVMVAMTLMMVFMAMFLSSIVQIFGAANRTEAVATAQGGANIAFARLDKELRYAAGISAPARVGGGDWYVEYLTINTGTPVCAELRLNTATAQLQRRSWLRDTGVPQTDDWRPLASDVTSDTPFEFFAPDATNSFQRLRINLVVTVGLGANSGSTQTDVTFSALNTSLSTESSAVCGEGRFIP